LKYSRGVIFRFFSIYKQEVHERKEKNETFEFKTPLVQKGIKMTNCVNGKLRGE
jgi:hypothetical protein